MINESKYKGCFVCLAIADSYGAFYEGGIVERLLWRLIGKTSDGKKRFTDDTQMSLDIAASYIEKKGIDQQHLAQTFAANYQWSRGYGPTAAKLLKGIKNGGEWAVLNRRKFKDGSMGNGAAMRAPIVALCHPVIDQTLAGYVRKTAEITHANPLAIEGAYIIAVATCMALNDSPNEHIIQFIAAICVSEEYKEKLRRCKQLYLSESVARKDIKRRLGNGILATESCMTSLYFALKYRDSRLEDMLGEIFKLGGDTDTIGAMAGAIWGAFNGDKDISHLAKAVESIDKIENFAVQLHEKYLTGEIWKKEK